jgi:hypothetical protein
LIVFVKNAEFLPNMAEIQLKPHILVGIPQNREVLLMAKIAIKQAMDTYRLPDLAMWVIRYHETAIKTGCFG